MIRGWAERCNRNARRARRDAGSGEHEKSEARRGERGTGVALGGKGVLKRQGQCGAGRTGGRRKRQGRFFGPGTACASLSVPFCSRRRRRLTCSPPTRFASLPPLSLALRLAGRQGARDGQRPCTHSAQARGRSAHGHGRSRGGRIHSEACIRFVSVVCWHLWMQLSDSFVATRSCRSAPRSSHVACLGTSPRGALLCLFRSLCPAVASLALFCVHPSRITARFLLPSCSRLFTPAQASCSSPACPLPLPLSAPRSATRLFFLALSLSRFFPLRPPRLSALAPQLTRSPPRSLPPTLSVSPSPRRSLAALATCPAMRCGRRPPPSPVRRSHLLPARAAASASAERPRGLGAQQSAMPLPRHLPVLVHPLPLKLRLAAAGARRCARFRRSASFRRPLAIGRVSPCHPDLAQPPNRTMRSGISSLKEKHTVRSESRGWQGGAGSTGCKAEVRKEGRNRRDVRMACTGEGRRSRRGWRKRAGVSSSASPARTASLCFIAILDVGAAPFEMTNIGKPRDARQRGRKVQTARSQTHRASAEGRGVGDGCASWKGRCEEKNAGKPTSNKGERKRERIRKARSGALRRERAGKERWGGRGKIGGEQVGKKKDGGVCADKRMVRSITWPMGDPPILQRSHGRWEIHRLYDGRMPSQPLGPLWTMGSSTPASASMTSWSCCSMRVSTLFLLGSSSSPAKMSSSRMKYACVEENVQARENARRKLGGAGDFERAGRRSKMRKKASAFKGDKEKARVG